jgi:hypothetical protein
LDRNGFCQESDARRWYIGKPDALECF